MGTLSAGVLLYRYRGQELQVLLVPGARSGRTRTPPRGRYRKVNTNRAKTRCRRPSASWHRKRVSTWTRLWSTSEHCASRAGRSCTCGRLVRTWTTRRSGATTSASSGPRNPARCGRSRKSTVRNGSPRPSPRTNCTRVRCPFSIGCTKCSNERARPPPTVPIRADHRHPSFQTATDEPSVRQQRRSDSS